MSGIRRDVGGTIKSCSNIMFVVLGLRCLLDCHVLKGFGIYMIGILDRLY